MNFRAIVTIILFTLTTPIFAQPTSDAKEDAPRPLVPEAIRRMREKSAQDAVKDKISGDGGAERKARECIAFWQRQVADQNAIAKEVGFIDKNVMYQAGVNIVSCKRQLKQIQDSKLKN